MLLYLNWSLFNISFFYIISLLLLVLTQVLLIFNNPIYSIFYLVLVFFCSSFLFISLNLYFLALMILIVYLGALIVLFLFVVMMLNIKSLEINRSINFFPFLFVFLSAFFLLFLQTNYFDFISIENFNFLIYTDWSKFFFISDNFLVLANILYLSHYFSLLLLGLILLVAMIGSIVLTLQKERFYKKQKNYSQVFRQFKSMAAK